MTRRRSPCARQGLFWTEGRPQREFDLKRLRPRYFATGQRFETITDGEKLSSLRIEKLRRNGLPWSRKLARVLSECSRAHPCQNPGCALCTRRFRRWFAGETLRLHAGEHRQSFVVTILLDVVPAQALPQVKLPLWTVALRKRLQRAKLKGALAIGGLEASYKHEDDTFVLHAHLLLINASDMHIDCLRARRQHEPVAESFLAQPVADPVKQLSYLLKIADYHRPGAQTGSRKPRAYPLPKAAFAAWMQWVSRHKLTDFVFLFGVRRHGNRVEHLAHEREARA